MQLSYLKNSLFIFMFTLHGIISAATQTQPITETVSTIQTPETATTENNPKQSRFERLKAWMKANPKKTAAIITGTLCTAAFVAYKLNKSSQEPQTNTPTTWRISRSFEPLVKQFPIVFAPAYTMGMMWDHYGYDLGKSQKSFDHLKKTFGLTDSQTYQPNPIGDKELAQVHTQEYLKRMTNEDFVKNDILKKDNGVDLAILAPRKKISIDQIDKALLAPMRLQTSGTALAAELALKHGFAFNLGGGFHHSKPNGSDNKGNCANCLYADINLAIVELQKIKPGIKIMVIDLDAHHGNGYAMMKDPTDSMHKPENDNIVLFDVYNMNSEFGPGIHGTFTDDITGKAHTIAFSGNHHTKQFVNYEYRITKDTTGEQYQKLIERTLPQAIDKEKPDFIIYNAGTDTMRGDRTTRVNEILPEDIIARDEFVFQQATQRNIPIISLFSGGYAPDCADVIGRSLENVINKFFKKEVEKIAHGK